MESVGKKASMANEKKMVGESGWMVSVEEWMDGSVDGMGHGMGHGNGRRDGQEIGFRRDIGWMGWGLSVCVLAL